MKKNLTRILFLGCFLLIPVMILVTHLYEEDNALRGEAVSSMNKQLCSKIESKRIKKGCLEDVARRIKLKNECEIKNAADISKCKSFYR
jgi:hypothetical protein